MNEKEVLEICRQIDSVIAEQLAESIIKGTSYEKLEAHYGILPTSKNCFYRKRRKAKKIMDRCERGELHILFLFKFGKNQKNWRSKSRYDIGCFEVGGYRIWTRRF